MCVVEGLDLIQSDVELLGIDLDLQLKTAPSNDLTSVATHYALAASDCYVVTALPDHLSTIGLSILEEGVRKLNKDFKPNFDSW